MKTIQTIITVGPDKTGTLRLPQDVAQGTHSAIVLLDAAAAPATPLAPPRRPLDLPLHDVGPWPVDLSLRREDLYGDDGR